MKGFFEGKGQFDRQSTLVEASGSASLQKYKAPGRAPEVLWSGHFYDLSGYAKLNRELLFRVANTIRVSLHRGGVCAERVLVDPLTRNRLDAHSNMVVSAKAPLLQVYTPVMDVRGRCRVCYTMTETQRIHADFIYRLNVLYDEVWFPTQWNLDVARDSGLKIPGRVMPLGVNPFIYKYKEDCVLPKCSLLTTERAGVFEVPKGFVFVVSGVPTFRKGFDVIVNAFEDAFADDQDVSLVLLTTYAQIATPRYNPWKGGPTAMARKARVYELTGQFTEHELADILNGCNAYVCASRGEGWNLPLTEAAACGLPVIAPLAYSHHEFLDEKVAFTFRPDGYEPIEGSENISHWYEGMPFAVFKEKAHATLVDLMRFVKSDPSRARSRADLFLSRLQKTYTWDIAGNRATQRLLELQP